MAFFEIYVHQVFPNFAAICVEISPIGACCAIAGPSQAGLLGAICTG
jgi:hypothetical protein